MVVFRRELRSYFATPLAYVFIVIFLVLAAVFTFQVGGLFERGQADLQPFFAGILGCISFSYPRYRCVSGRRSATAAASNF